MAELQGSYSLVTHYRSVSVAVITALTCFQLWRGQEPAVLQVSARGVSVHIPGLDTHVVS